MINMENRIIIIDGNSLINRAYYAMQRPMITKEGIYTQGIYGFVNMLKKINREYESGYIVVTFDLKAPTFRHKEYSEYKAGRKKMPPELAMQMPILKDLLKAMNIKIVQEEGFEADDLIGTIARCGEEEGLEPLIITGDKDALQLATDKTKVMITKKGISEFELYDHDFFVENYGFTPTEFIDYKGLMGDKSDNIPGVPGVGEKTAFKLIKEYGSIENVLMNISNISGKKLKESLEEYSEQAIFSKKLATIITEVPVEIPLEQLKTKGSFNNHEVREMCLKLQLKSILSKLQNLDVDTDSGVIHETKREDAKFELIKDCSSLEKIISSIKGDMFVKFYVDNTNSFDDISLGTIGILSQGTIYIISCKNLLEESKDRFLISIKSIFENSDVYKISHGVKYGYTSLLKLGVDLDEVDFDLELAAYLLDSSKSEYSIKTIIEEKTGEVISGEGDSFIANEILAMKEIYPILKDKIESSDMNELLFNVEQPLTKAISYMEYEGFNIDRSELDKLGDKFSLEISELTTKIYELAGEEFNVNSPKQLGKILFEKLDLPVIKKTKTGYSTNAEVLDALKDKHEIINKILYFRQITKLYSTYIEGLKHVIDEDGRIHSNFTQTVTTTGRLSSTEPNLQNIPIRSENGRSIRKVFIPHNEESIILSADYSQIELRVLAHISGDENMIKAFNSNIDIHTATASEVFNVPIEEVTKTMRSNAKAVNFGIVYGIGDFSLAQDLGITRIEAKNYIDTYLHRYENVKKYMDMVIDEAEENSYVTTLLNRKRYIPEIKSSNKMIKALGKRLAMNAPIQGSAADIIKIAMVNVAKELKNKGLKSKLILQVHDELILNVYKNEMEQVKELVRNEMEGVLDLKVLLKADISIGDTWYEAK